MIEEMEGQLSIFDLDSWSGKMSQEPSRAIKEKTSKPCSPKSSKSQSQTRLMCLCLKRESGPTQGSYTMKWADGQLRGDSSTLNFGESPNVGKESLWLLTSQVGGQMKSCLSNVLETNPDMKYNLSAKACQGILNRAQRRGKTLPEQLEKALRIQAEGGQ